MKGRTLRPDTSTHSIKRTEEAKSLADRAASTQVLAFVAEAHLRDLFRRKPAAEEDRSFGCPGDRRQDAPPDQARGGKTQAEFLMQFAQKAVLGRLVAFAAAAGKVPKPRPWQAGVGVAETGQDLPAADQRHFRADEGHATWNR